MFAGSELNRLAEEDSLWTCVSSRVFGLVVQVESQLSNL